MCRFIYLTEKGKLDQRICTVCDNNHSEQYVDNNWESI